MNCLDQYRRKLLAESNRDLRIIAAAEDEAAIHRFRVGVKRLTALYRFLGSVEPAIKAKKLLRPARRLSSAISRVRDCHITLNLFPELGELDAGAVLALRQALQARIRRDYQAFRTLIDGEIRIPLRLPTVQALGVSQSAILRHKPQALQQLRDGITAREQRLDARLWHDKRILLKRYHHTLEAFSECPGHTLDEKELMQMKMLEQLLGDWHDRVIAVEILQSFTDVAAQAADAIAMLGKQERLLLGAARIYLARFALWQADHR